MDIRTFSKRKNYAPRIVSWYPISKMTFTAGITLLLMFAFLHGSMATTKPLNSNMSLQNKTSTLITEKRMGGLRIQTISKTNCNSSELVYLSILHNKHSYGKNRGIKQFVEMITNQTTMVQSPSIGLLVSDQDELATITKFMTINFDMLPFSRIVIVHYPETAITDRANRKDDKIQKDRRRRLAILRNTLSFIAISDEDHVIWIDGDIVEIPKGLSQRMINSKKDIVVPSCYLVGGDYDYDLNSWVGERTHPSPEEIEGIKKGQLYVPRHAGAKFITDLKSQNQTFVEIDSVGGTMLYSKTELFRQGVNFPPLYVVGTDWDRNEGWDGIETEGLCYVAKSMGYKCWAMPFEVIRHTNEK